MREMARVIFTANLRTYTGGVTETEASGARVCDLLRDLDAKIPGIRHYLVTDQGVLRQHVNVFVNEELVGDRVGLTDAIPEGGVVHILQALSGG